jgi:hypothetical protein
MALNGHVDVVPTGDTSAWSHDPWGGEISQGKLWGRGACDMKGGVAAMIQAVKVVQDCGFRLKGDVYVHVVSDVVPEQRIAVLDRRARRVHVPALYGELRLFLVSRFANPGFDLR